ncbi:hypothetical protein LUZ63_001254 [Rhynchospora breviuscula]|uniref:HAT C-terminal dimerisation domain-containing protein n=1 Tax=Rhynchospora breviuscula TaxID=2022672 RepID=A0A9Q0HXD9_9POAL|nr:hypothetical protein LUZ63_001254 [Rhynchospora breviuscula]
MGLETGDESEYVKAKFKEMYNIYEAKYRAGHGRHPTLSQAARSSSSSSGSGFKTNLMKALKRKGASCSTTVSSEADNEIDIYVASPFPKSQAENFDILDYWKRHEPMWPILASMAHDIFAVPVSTVASESAFSLCNRVLTDDRNRLGNKTFEMLVCLKDWFDADSRLQEPSDTLDNSDYATSQPGQSDREDFRSGPVEGTVTADRDDYDAEWDD